MDFADIEAKFKNALLQRKAQSVQSSSNNEPDNVMLVIPDETVWKIIDFPTEIWKLEYLHVNSNV